MGILVFLMYCTKMVTNANIIHLSKDARDVLTSSKYFTRASTKYQWLPRLPVVTYQLPLLFLHHIKGALPWTECPRGPFPGRPFNFPAWYAANRWVRLRYLGGSQGTAGTSGPGAWDSNLASVTYQLCDPGHAASVQPLHPHANSERGSWTRSIGISGNLLEMPRPRSHPDSLPLVYSLIRPQVVCGHFEVGEAGSVSLSVRIYHGVCDNPWPGLQLSSQSSLRAGLSLIVSSLMFFPPKSHVAHAFA